MRELLYTPLSWLYGLAVNFRHRLFDWGVLKGEQFDIPIICIGNITVGGTGKTPMAEMLISFLKRKHCVALISRGYGRRTKGYREVTIDAHYRDVGDEPLQIKRKFPDTTVVVCEKRVEGIRRLREEHPEVNLIVMDDGFQHRYVQPKINVLMVDSTRPIQSDKMLPAGTLRDNPEQLYRAHYFVVPKCPEKMAPIDRRILRKVLVKYAYQRIYFTRFETFSPQPLFPKEELRPLKQRGKVIALSGIVNPKPFLSTLNEQYRVVEEVTLKDHHVYRVRDMLHLEELLKRHPDAAIITTEKDAVKMGRAEKIPATVRRSLYYMPIDITFIEESATDFLQKIEEDVRSN